MLASQSSWLISPKLLLLFIFWLTLRLWLFLSFLSLLNIVLGVLSPCSGASHVLISSHLTMTSVSANYYRALARWSVTIWHLLVLQTGFYNDTHTHLCSWFNDKSCKNNWHWISRWGKQYDTTRPKPLGTGWKSSDPVCVPGVWVSVWSLSQNKSHNDLKTKIRFWVECRKEIRGLSFLFDFSWGKNTDVAIFIRIQVSFLFSQPAVICLLFKKE